MPLTMRPTGLASPVDQRQDYTVYSGEWPMGRIYQERGMPEDMGWFWSIFTQDIFINQGDPDATKHAYALATNRWKAKAIICEREELMAAVDDAINLAADECPQCAKIRDA